MNNLHQILAGEPAYRLKQIYSAWFDPAINGYAEITTLSKGLREKLESLPWLPLKLKLMQESKIDGTKKALLELGDGELIETVLMGRERKIPPLTPPSKGGDRPSERYTICISTQVGCPMGCVFCATGKLGFKRNLTAEEIVGQVRFCQKDTPVSNIVLMGQGEPLLNYDNVKEALNIILANTDIGPRHITLSTCGVKAGMERMLTDEDWPPARFALSLHSAIDSTRAKIMPTHRAGFFDWLITWSKLYHRRFASRAQFIGLEYTLLKGINDDERHLKALKKLAAKLGRVRINLIPWNKPQIPMTNDQSNLKCQMTNDEAIKHWHNELMKAGFVATIRRSQGQDIAAACGQLALAGLPVRIPA